MTQHKKTIWLIFQNGAMLVLADAPKSPTLAPHDITEIESSLFCRHFLGNMNGTDYYCAELPEGIVLPNHITIIPLKKALELFQTDWYGLAAKAHAVITWDRNHQFCGRCAQPTKHLSALRFERFCESCRLYFYPRISPSIIVLINRDDHLLLARGPHFPPGQYGLIAGFVDAGENIEQAVHREVHEEVGIKIKALQYVGSQAWPFPDSLMIGFTACYDSGELKLDPNEIEEAGWYHYQKLPGYPSTSISIARHLIDSFVEQRSKK